MAAPDAKNANHPADPPTNPPDVSAAQASPHESFAGITSPPTEAELDEQVGAIFDQAEELAEGERSRIDELTRLMKRAGDAVPESMHTGGKFQIEVTDDQMAADLVIQPPQFGPLNISPQDVVDALREADVSFGVDPRRVANALSDAARSEHEQRVTVARGKSARLGKPGRLLWSLRETLDSDPTDLSVKQAQNLAGDKTVWLCRADDRIVVSKPPESGQAGKRINGTKVSPAKVKNAVIQEGRNVRVQDNAIYATADGSVSYDGTTVNVDPMLVIREDVSDSDGPIHFDGKIIVKAAVLPGARLEATGDIKVQGSVEAATIVSTGGDIELPSGVVGKDRAVIRAAGDLRVHFAEYATLAAGGEIRFAVGSLHCRITAGQDVCAERDRGNVAGGEVFAGRAVSVRKLGAAGGVETRITVGLGRDLLARLGELNQNEAELRARRNDAQEQIDEVEKAHGKLENLPPEQLRPIVKLKKVCLVCDAKLRQLEAKRVDWLENNEAMYESRVIASKEVLEQVTLRFGQREHRAKPQRGPVTFRRDEDSGQITTKPVKRKKDKKRAA